MLVLKRKLNQCIVIDDYIKVWVLGINMGQVSIGVEAPQNVKVYRKEIYERIHNIQTPENFNK